MTRIIHMRGGKQVYHCKFSHFMLSGTYYINSRGRIVNHGCTVQSLSQTKEYKQVQLTRNLKDVFKIHTGKVKNTLLRNTENI